MEIKQINRYPRLDTVLMIESTIRKFDGELKKKELWKSMPERIIYQTYCVIIDYLLESGMISIDAEGKIGWIWNPELAEKYLSKPHLSWRK